MICSVKRFSEMYETVYRDLYHYALCLMKNPQEAEDAVSEAVVAAYENIHKLKKEEAFRSWIFTILTNKCKKRLKKALKEEPGREEELRNSRLYRIMIWQWTSGKHSSCYRKKNRY